MIIYSPWLIPCFTGLVRLYTVDVSETLNGIPSPLTNDKGGIVVPDIVYVIVYPVSWECT